MLNFLFAAFTHSQKPKPPQMIWHEGGVSFHFGAESWEVIRLSYKAKKLIFINRQAVINPFVDTADHVSYFHESGFH